MKKLSLAILISVSGSISLLPASALATPEPEYTVVETQASNAELDSILAPIALYPDTLLTHILIASTYPLEVVSADRWRQSNLHLSAAQVEQALAPVSWDPSVKAIASFTDIIHTMANDLTWLQQLGDNVLVNETRILDRVQILRQHAYNAGNLHSNDYLNVEHEQQIIVIEPRRQEIVYVPYYDPFEVYGHWSYAIAPVRWHHKVSYHHQGRFYWAPQIRLSTFFYFGAIRWSNRQVVIHHRPVKHYYRGVPSKRVHNKEYQRWQHNVGKRQARYSKAIVNSAPKVYSQHRARGQSHRQGKVITSSKAQRQLSHTRQTNNAKVMATQTGRPAKSLNRKIVKPSVNTRTASPGNGKARILPTPKQPLKTTKQVVKAKKNKTIKKQNARGHQPRNESNSLAKAHRSASQRQAVKQPRNSHK